MYLTGFMFEKKPRSEPKEDVKCNFNDNISPIIHCFKCWQITDSLEEGHWKLESDYEVKDFPGAKVRL